jgi:hypothetical protein
MTYEPLAHRHQMRTAIGTGQRVHLVDDKRS